ncbi:MAG: DUF423 domain-containing protein [Candidatus Omnitrophica bacterium]|nr:DUF423 domain-containing protein [Candidatus Omnitrophota bacterium]
MNGPRWLGVAGVAGATGVIAGAFGAHALKETLEPDLLAIFDTGARYHLIHAVALLGVALLALRDPGNVWLNRAGWAFLLGVGVFSGSLYLLALTGVRTFGGITPFGGAALILGWVMLVPAAREADSD